MDTLSRGRRPALGGEARGGLAARLREPTSVVFLALFGLIAVGWVLVALDGGQFLTTESIVGIQQRSAALGIVAIGQTLAILAGSLDLSVAYLISLTSLVAAEIMAGQDGNILPAVAAVLAVSALVGLVNGLVITRLHVHAFIATLGVALIIRGIVDHLYDGPAGKVPESFQLLGYSRIGPIPVSALLWAGVAVVAWFLLSRTRLGYRVYAVGGNEEVARLSGIRTSRVIVLTHVLCSICAGVAGLLLASRLGAGAPTVGTDGGYDLESIAAVVLGGTALAGGKGGVAGTVGGVLLLAVLDTIFNQLEVNSFVKDVVRGVVIVIAVAVYARRIKGRSA
ncbi:Ribose ABC transport system, permease protein RbsC (TC 3.A.1.2.1) [[Actinomadura] parvosata subsp. kistnae]|uniref:ABC transporter permease n=1 Tax=[Actinomadura] parvosata subsp. kistnae TaxID=1909395 RepID=A0A1U9ZWH9_9ACTN|nr:ABC transporter permease [Nonomuraea sp. ATCC 55076]AQZ62316.1 ABC transporter permease [Nonomuraea sp. ATCC 55076]SPL99677.1 Ribose ABC transport system, permease protein RbsC (TC 3.A.1.2.1) [Actinomadura parvosata subsp. kistnae]